MQLTWVGPSAALPSSVHCIFPPLRCRLDTICGGGRVAQEGRLAVGALPEGQREKLRQNPSQGRFAARLNRGRSGERRAGVGG